MAWTYLSSTAHHKANEISKAYKPSGGGEQLFTEVSCSIRSFIMLREQPKIFVIEISHLLPTMLYKLLGTTLEYLERHFEDFA